MTLPNCLTSRPSSAPSFAEMVDRELFYRLCSIYLSNGQQGMGFLLGDTQLLTHSSLVDNQHEVTLVHQRLSLDFSFASYYSPASSAVRMVCVNVTAPKAESACLPLSGKYLENPEIEVNQAKYFLIGMQNTQYKIYELQESPSNMYGSMSYMMKTKLAVDDVVSGSPIFMAYETHGQWNFKIRGVVAGYCDQKKEIYSVGHESRLMPSIMERLSGKAISSVRVFSGTFRNAYEMAIEGASVLKLNRVLNMIREYQDNILDIMTLNVLREEEAIMRKEDLRRSPSYQDDVGIEVLYYPHGAYSVVSLCHSSMLYARVLVHHPQVAAGSQRPLFLSGEAAAAALLESQQKGCLKHCDAEILQGKRKKTVSM